MRREMQAIGRGLVAALVLTVAAGAGAANIWVVDGNSFPPTFNEIQDAIDIASPGDTIVVRSSGGPYDEVLINKDNLTVVGAGDTEIDDCSSATDDYQVLIQASGVRFQGFHLINDGCAGILVTGSDNWVVANWVEDADGDGINLDGDSKRNTVLGNWVTNANEESIDNNSGSGFGHLIAYNVLSGAGGDGIEFENRKVTVDYNVAVNNDDDGIDINNEDADQFKVTNNIALDNGDDLERDSGAIGTFKKNVFETCNPITCPAF